MKQEQLKNEIIKVCSELFIEKIEHTGEENEYRVDFAGVDETLGECLVSVDYDSLTKKIKRITHVSIGDKGNYELSAIYVPKWDVVTEKRLRDIEIIVGIMGA